MAEKASSLPYSESNLPRKNPADTGNILPPLTLGDLEDSDSNDGENILLTEQGGLQSNSASGRQKSIYSKSVAMGSPHKKKSSKSIARPSSSSYERWKNRGTRTSSSDDLDSDFRFVHTAESYRILKHPSYTTQFPSTSAPTSLRKSAYMNGSRDVTSSDDDQDNLSFQHLVANTSEFSLSPVTTQNRQFPGESPLINVSLDSTLSEFIEENPAHARPVSARSNCTSVTILGADAEREKLRSLKEDNARLHELVSSLSQQLEMRNSKAMKKSVDFSTAEGLREEIISLKEEAEASETALRRAEEALERSEMVCQGKIQNIHSLKSEIDHLKSLLAETELSKQSTARSCKEAHRDAEHLAQELEQMQTAWKNARRNSENEKASYNREIQKLQSQKVQIATTIASLEKANTNLHSDLRDAMMQIESLDSSRTEWEKERINLVRQIDELKARFVVVKTDLEIKTENLEGADHDLSELQRELKSTKEQNALQQDLLKSCQSEVEELRTKTRALEVDLRKAQANVTFTPGPSTSGKGSPADDADLLMADENCPCDVNSPRKTKAVVAELKMKLAAKEAQVQRLEAHVNTYSMEAEKLEGLRGELINFVERSRTGDKRAHELEDIVHRLEDERSKVMRQLIECEDDLKDKKAQCESLEARLSERTVTLTNAQSELSELKKLVSKLQSDMKNLSSCRQALETNLGLKTQECEFRYKELQRAEEELAEKQKALDNAAERAGRREAETKRDVGKMKKIHMEQHEVMEKEIDKLQQACSRYKDETNDMQCVICQLREENEALRQQLESQELELEKFLRNDSLMKKENEGALEKITKNARESAEQVQQLQSALEQCRVEISQYSEQLQSANDRFNHQMALKDEQVSKLEADLKISNESLKSESQHVKSLENNVAEKEKAMKQSSERISELENCQACLKTKVAKLEKRLLQLTSKSEQERQYWDGRVQAACSELEAKNQQFTQLNNALKEVEKEFNSCRKELSTVEQQFLKLQVESNEKSKQLKESREQAKKAGEELATATHKLSDLEARLENSNSERQALHGKSLTQESELIKAKAEIQSLAQENGQIKSANKTMGSDIRTKDASLARLQNALRETKDQLLAKERDVDELERALEDRQWELTQRAAQLGQLETTVKEHKSISEKRHIELQAEARKVKVELKERNTQLGNLDEQLSDLRNELSEQRHQVCEKEQELRRLKAEGGNKDERISNLEKALEESRSSYADCHRNLLEVKQELRVAREQLQRTTQQWHDTHRETEALKREYDNTTANMEDRKKVEKEKEARLIELTAKLVTLEAEKNNSEQRYTAELDRLRNDVLKLHNQHQAELYRMRNDHMKAVNEAKNSVETRSGDLKSALDREQQVKTECEMLKQTVMSLEKEVLARKQVIEAANDTIILKEAEIARLETKLSGLVREKQMEKALSLDPEGMKISEEELPDFLPSFLATAEQSPEIRFTSTQRRNESLSPSDKSATLFSGLGPDSTFLSLRVFEESRSDAALHSDAVELEPKPENSVAALRESLRASEQRRREVASKLRRLKTT